MITFRDAIKRALEDELAADASVVLFGEDIAAAGGVFKVTEGIAERFGPDRVFDTPISELAISGAAFGAAVTGLRPVVEIMFGDFMALAMDSLINQAAKWRYVSGEQTTVPLTMRCTVGAGARFGPVHCQIPATWLQGVPGLRIVCPSNPADAYALLRGSIRDDDPVVFLEHKRLYGNEGELRDEQPPLGKASIVREGSDLTLVSVMKGVVDALDAAAALEDDGVSAEVVDLRGLRPLDVGTVVRSLERTGRLFCIEEGPRTGGWAAGLVGEIAADALDVLDDVALLCTPDHPIPFSPPLEDAALPGVEAILAAVRARAGIG